MTNPDRRVKIKELAFSEDSQTFDLYVTHAYLQTSFCEALGTYLLADLEVQPRMRQQGLAKLLLHKSLEHAQSLEARVIIAPIVSRECLDAMINVFGSEHIEVAKRGDYAPPAENQNYVVPTDAMLYRRLD